MIASRGDCGRDVPSALEGTTAAAASALHQYAPDAASLFNNMKLPATILAGSIVPLGLLNPLPLRNPDGRKENRLHKTLRHLYLVCSVMSLLSELISVMWATVAVNQLIETPVKPAGSVWELLQRDFELSWAGTNAHFLAGMWGFSFLVGCRAFFLAGTGLFGWGLAGMSCSGLLLMISIVNRGVARGSGDGLRFGSTIFALLSRYVTLLVGTATKPGNFGPLAIGSVFLMMWSALIAMYAVSQRSKPDMLGKM